VGALGGALHRTLGQVTLVRDTSLSPPRRSGVTLRRAARGYIYATAVAASLIVLAAAAAAGRGAAAFDGVALPAVLAQFAIMAVLAQHFPLPLGQGRKYDLSQPIHFAVLLVAGIPLATLVVFASAAVGQTTLIVRRDRLNGARLRLPMGALFNTCQVTIALATAGCVHDLVAASVPQLAALPDVMVAIISVTAAGGALYLANTWAVAVMTGLHRSISPVAVWRSGPRWRALRSASLLLLAAIGAHTTAESAWAPLAIAVPGALIFVALRSAAVAEAAVRLRDDFLGVAAHELRTPVTSLRGYAQYLVANAERTGLSADPKVVRALETIDRQSGTLCSLIDQLLDLSRLGLRPTLECEAFDAVALARAVATAYQPLAPGFRLVVRAEQPVPAWGDRIRLEQVLINLIANAVRHAGRGDQIDIEVTATPFGRDTGGVNLAVRDYGIGIPTQYRERIFERYEQVGWGNKAGGLGIGLFLVREIVELHGGSVSVEAPRDGGSRFSLRLPAPPQRARAA
jgi:signal transduction histidine kinase